MPLEILTVQCRVISVFTKAPNGIVNLRITSVDDDKRSFFSLVGSAVTPSDVGDIDIKPAGVYVVDRMLCVDVLVPPSVAFDCSDGVRRHLTSVLDNDDEGRSFNVNHPLYSHWNPLAKAVTPEAVIKLIYHETYNRDFKKSFIVDGIDIRTVGESWKAVAARSFDVMHSVGTALQSARTSTANASNATDGNPKVTSLESGNLTTILPGGTDSSTSPGASPGAPRVAERVESDTPSSRNEDNNGNGNLLSPFLSDLTSDYLQGIDSPGTKSSTTELGEAFDMSFLGFPLSNTRSEDNRDDDSLAFTEILMQTNFNNSFSSTETQTHHHASNNTVFNGPRDTTGYVGNSGKREGKKKQQAKSKGTRYSDGLPYQEMLCLLEPTTVFGNVTTDATKRKVAPEAGASSTREKGRKVVNHVPVTGGDNQGTVYYKRN
ncbi:hypothetical protein K435DRAFT_799109 [Dendrothele bispora CBS 962.96]|uniref:Uncharacterized protein n=1 Tax=Dendrothele bispora (strain CBS 962.96) TaxID=1314807 RepID=A0A4S8LXB5_DENBC|nr:hypothetical protein K435DRAFT_799109 [Dendrothele bispora CBS 962.96]